MITIKADLLTAFLKHALKLGSPKVITLKPMEKDKQPTLQLYVSSPKSSAFLIGFIPILEGKVKDFLESTVSLPFLLTATEKRSLITLSATSALLEVKEKKFSTVIKKLDYSTPQKANLSSLNLKLDDELAGAFKEALDFVSMKPSDILPTYLVIKLGKKGIFAAAASTAKAKIYRNREVRSDTEYDLAVPYEDFLSCLPLFKGAPMSISFENGYLRVWNDRLIYTSQVSQDSKLQYAQVSALYDKVASSKSDELPVPSEKFLEAITKFSKSNTDNSKIRLVSSKNDLTISMESSHGRMQYEFSNKKKALPTLSVSVDPNTLNDLLSKYKRDLLNLNFLNNMLFVREKENKVDKIRLCLLSS